MVPVIDAGAAQGSAPLDQRDAPAELGPLDRAPLSGRAAPDA
jgi:hypothetical protein